MTPGPGLLQGYVSALGGVLSEVAATSAQGEIVPMDSAISWAVKAVEARRAGGAKLMFIGNGGSAAIASHMAIDYNKNGGIPSVAFNDAASLTCLANDLGYERVFAHQIETFGRTGDMLIAISSSGSSRNILEAVSSAKKLDIEVLTLSGFQSENELRKTGDMNLYVPNREFGFVEIAHLALCHAVLDLTMGWKPETA